MDQVGNNEIELADLIEVLWKRKWLIVLPTLFCVVLVGAVSFMLPSIWDVDMIVSPSKFLAQTEQGTYIEVVFSTPEQIAARINEHTYDNLIANELEQDVRILPEINAEALNTTGLVRIYIKENDIEKAQHILQTLFNHLKNDLDSKADIEIKNIGSQIASNSIEKMRLEKENISLKNKLNLVRQREKEIEEEMSDTRKRIETLEKEQRASLKKSERSESESLALLLYSNEIQQSLRYYNNQNELLSTKRMDKENYKLQIERNTRAMEQIENLIDILNEKKGRIDFTQLVKEPTVSPFPVSPRKKLNVMIAGIISLILFTLLAFLIEYVEKSKSKP